VDNPIGEWLRETRLRQITPGKRKPWSQDYLLERMQEEVGWSSHRPNYSKYETGKSKPEPDTLDKFIAFWTARGEPGPDLSPKRVQEPPADPLAAAIRAQTEAITALVEELRLARLQQVEVSEVALRAIGALGAGRDLPRTPDGAEHEAAQGTHP
jgi:hypothetical protein